MIAVFFVLCVVLSGGAVVVTMRFERPGAASGARLLQQLLEAGSTAPARQASSRTSQTVSAMGGALGRALPSLHNAQSQERLSLAGYDGADALNGYALLRIAAPAVALAAAVASPVAKPVLLFFLPLLALVLPNIVLARMAKKRGKRIRKSLPDVIDLLVICVEAGLGLDQATNRVADEMRESHPDMSSELVRLGREQRAGKPRLEAWQAVAERLHVDEVDAFVSMIVQAERFGTPIARALSNFATNTRLQRTQRAEEEAAKTTIKISFPLILFIFPCMFIVLLGPAALTLMQNFSKGFK